MLKPKMRELAKINMKRPVACAGTETAEAETKD